MANKAARPTAAPLKVTRAAPPVKGVGAAPGAKVPLVVGPGLPEAPVGAWI